MIKNSNPHRGRKAALTFLVVLFSLSATTLTAQVTERERPAEWAQLVEGARFMDRFLPMPQGTKGEGIWGTDSVQGRYVDNGIELPDISFWGGNILQTSDGKYHLYVCGWPPMPAPQPPCRKLLWKRAPARSLPPWMARRRYWASLPYSPDA